MVLPHLRRLVVPATLALLLCAGALPAAAEDALTPAQKAAVEQAIRDYLKAHPEAVLDALKAAQQKSEAAAAEEARHVIADHHAELFDNPDDLVAGDPKGDATLVEFFDYRCPYCKQIEPTLDALLQEDKKLRIVYKEFPILGEASVYAARAALAAKKQGRYAEFHRMMMATKGDITSEVVLKVASAAGLDLGRLKSDMASHDIDRVIANNLTLANLLDIQGTPGFVIGDVVIPGAVDITRLRADIAKARKAD